ncbi:probable quinone oxidoreductase [Ramularia collo-cygni]|uniref:Probable quinone oxidoreductase n=1 Tax=Ramularia collo-cygni TaxID=112498 RepID=A0A2D3UYX5_9PEZI|nr:probable quinone oxidoreductase [Ramularia collo-cygni]CZT14399.1 probable quinone oxidoreductase [Ramularia collo-cygni]
MKAVAVKDGKGPLENLHITEIERPIPNGSQALVKVKAFGLNRMDILQREGKYPVPPQAPKTLGVEFSGTIEELAEGSERGFKKGDEVFGLAYGGAYAEYIAVSTHMLVHKPKELSFEEVAGVPEVYITAIQAMYLIGEYEPGKSILWHAGASSVSIAGQQLSRENGASKIFATARSDAKVQFCKEKLGSTAAYNTTTTKWDEEVLKATDGKGVDIIVDFIGPDTFAANLNAIAKDGRIVNLATLSGMNLKDTNANFGAFVAKRVRYEGSSLRSRDEAYQGKLRDHLVEHALPMFVSGKIKSVIEKVYPWEQIQEAHKKMEANDTMGKLICTIS